MVWLYSTLYGRGRESGQFHSAYAPAAILCTKKHTATQLHYVEDYSNGTNLWNNWNKKIKSKEGKSQLPIGLWIGLDSLLMMESKSWIPEVISDLRLKIMRLSHFEISGLSGKQASGNTIGKLLKWLCLMISINDFAQDCVFFIISIIEKKNTRLFGASIHSEKLNEVLLLTSLSFWNPVNNHYLFTGVMRDEIVISCTWLK